MSDKKWELCPFNEEILSVMNNIVKNSKQKINKVNIVFVPKDFKKELIERNVASVIYRR